MNYFLWINDAQAGPYTWAQIKAMLAEKSILPETLFWQEGMADWQPISTLLDPATGMASRVPPVAVDPNPRIFSGFFRRLGALIIDWIILSLAGHIFGSSFFDSLSGLGSAGPLIGLVIAVLYFGLQNSILCGGQTLGKRLLGIEVVDIDGKSILPAHSIVRYLILGLPFFVMDPAVLGPILTTTQGLFLGALMFFWIATIIYFFLFNVPTRQSLHDLFVRTYVVRIKTKGPVTSSKFWLGHYVLLGAIGFFMMAMMGAAGLLMQWGPFPQLLAMQRTLQTDPHIEYVSASAGKNYTFGSSGSRETNSLQVAAFWHGKPDNMDAAARSVARTILSKAPDEAARQDVLAIKISYGYDIGIASGSVSSTFAHTPEEWEKIVANSSTP